MTDGATPAGPDGSTDDPVVDLGGVPYDDDFEDEDAPDTESTRGARLAHDSGRQLVARGIAYPTAVPVGMTVLKKFTMRRWGGMDLGTLAWAPRPMRGGRSPSLHNWGMAWDWRYANPGRGRRSADEAIDFLLDNAAPLGIQAIHDYSAGRYWKAYRRAWKNGTKSRTTGMGYASSQWLHIERTWAAANDKRSIEQILDESGTTLRPSTTTDGSDGPTKILIPGPEIVRGEVGAHVAQLQDFLRKFGFAKFTRSDGKFGPKTFAAVTAAQEHFAERRWYTKRIDGQYGPRTAKAAATFVAQLDTT